MFLVVEISDIEILDKVGILDSVCGDWDIK